MENPERKHYFLDLGVQAEGKKRLFGSLKKEPLFPESNLFFLHHHPLPSPSLSSDCSSSSFFLFLSSLFEISATYSSNHFLFNLSYVVAAHLSIYGMFVGISNNAGSINPIG